MEARILQPMVYKHKLAKPLLVITGETQGTQSIRRATGDNTRLG